MERDLYAKLVAKLKTLTGMNEKVKQAEEDIDAIEANLSKQILDVNFSSVTAASGTFLLEKAITGIQSGFSPVSIAGFDLSRSNGLFITKVIINNDKIEVGGYNNSGSDLTINGTVYVLCLKF